MQRLGMGSDYRRIRGESGLIAIHIFGIRNGVIGPVVTDPPCLRRVTGEMDFQDIQPGRAFYPSDMRCFRKKTNRQAGGDVTLNDK